MKREQASVVAVPTSLVAHTPAPSLRRPVRGACDHLLLDGTTCGRPVHARGRCNTHGRLANPSHADERQRKHMSEAEQRLFALIIEEVFEARVVYREYLLDGIGGRNTRVVEVNKLLEVISEVYGEARLRYIVQVVNKRAGAGERIPLYNVCHQE